MAELYHAKKKKKGLSGVVDNLNNLDKGVDKAKGIAYGVKAGYEYNKPKGGLPSLPNKKHSTSKLTVFAKSATNTANDFATQAKTTKAKSTYSGALSKVKNDNNEEDNPPKNFRKRLNHVKLKSIVGPKDRKFYGEEGLNSAQSENKRAQQYRYADWVAQPMPTSPGGTKHRRSKGS